MIEITESRLQTSKRLQNLEFEMAKIISSTSDKISVEELKSHFSQRASLKTVRGILGASNSLFITTDNIAAVTVRLKYTITGINLESIIIGGKNNNLNTGYLSGVLLNANNTISLEVIQSGPVNSIYTFKASEIENISSSYTHSNDPIVSDNRYATINIKEN